MNHTIPILLAATLAAGAAQAATITLSTDRPAISGTTLDLGGFALDGSNTGPLSTNVGAFTGIGETGTGRSRAGNGTAVQVQGPSSPAARFGRFGANTGDRWIDSEDMTGVRWDIPDGNRYAAIFLTDANDIPSTPQFEITTAGATASVARQANGSAFWVRFAFEGDTGNSVLFSNVEGEKDGFGLANAEIAPVPLPAAAWLLLGGIAALGVASRRKRRAV